MDNDELEIIRRKLQSRLDISSNVISEMLEDDLSKRQWKYVRESQKLDKKLMAALVELQRENKALWKMGVEMTKALLKI